MISLAVELIPKPLKIIALCWIIGLCGCSDAPSDDQVRALAAPAGADSMAPHLSRASDGSVILSWLGRDQGDSVLRYAKLRNGQWSATQDVVRDPEILRNWADVAVVEEVENGVLVAHWPRTNSASSHAYDTWFQLSSDGGETWTTATQLGTDGVAAEYGFVSAYASDDNVGMIWLDGRNIPLSSYGDAATELRNAHFSPTGERLDEQVLDARVCDCCQTDAVTARGRTYIAYRDRTVDELRDIALNIRTDDWAGARKVTPDQWTISACPVNGPALAATGNALASVWFTGADGKPRIRVVRSLDRGASFTETVVKGIDKPLGRVDIVLLHDARIILSWLESVGDGRAELRAQLYDLHGRTAGHRVIAHVSASRRSGFPQMVQTGQQLVFAWTDSDQPLLEVKTATLAISAL